MKTIWKFPLEITGVQGISMPEGAELLTVQVQRGCPCLWALVDSDAEFKEIVNVWTCGTGGPVSLEAKRYLGTYQVNSGKLVFHVFEGGR